MAMMVFILRLLLCVILIEHITCTNCPDGWLAFQGSCYLFSHEHKGSFVASEIFCLQQFNSHLVHVQTQEENSFIKDFISHLTVREYWIGLSDDAVDGLWKLSGTDITASFFDWNPSEPNGQTDEGCAASVSWHAGRWVDTPCSQLYNPLCELRTSGELEIVG